MPHHYHAKQKPEVRNTPHRSWWKRLDDSSISQMYALRNLFGAAKASKKEKKAIVRSVMSGDIRNTNPTTGNKMFKGIIDSRYRKKANK